MLKYGEINPLNVFGIRQTGHCPPHFERVEFDIKTTEKKISDWIYENLAGRFWIGDMYLESVNDKPSMCKCVAFEEKSEASYFALCLDQINTYSNL
jgi:hypothetical protein